MNKKAFRIAGWALGLSLAVGGIGAAVGSGWTNHINEPLAVNAAASTSGTFDKVTNANNLRVGDEVIIANTVGDQALCNISTTKTKYGTLTSVSATDNSITLDDADVEVFTLESGHESSGFSFKGSSNLSNNYLTWTSGNSLNKQTSKDANSSWTVTSSDGTLTIANNSDSERLLRYNGNDSRFACYTSSTGTLAQIFKRRSSTPSVTIDQSNSTVYLGTTGLTVSATKSNAPDAVVSWTSSNTDVATVSTVAGVTKVLPVSAGSVTLTASITVSEVVYSSSITITVSEDYVSSLEEYDSIKTSFWEDDEFNLGGGSLLATYASGAEDLIDLKTEGVRVSLGSTDITGRAYYLESDDDGKTITISYGGENYEYAIDVVPAIDLDYPYFQLVERENELTAGMQFAIVSSTKGKAASTTASGTYLGEVGGSSALGKKFAPIDDIEIFTLGGSEDEWTLTSSGGDELYCGAAKSINYEDDGDDVNTWEISIDASSNATIQSTTASYGRILHNVSSTRFTTYTSATSSSMLLPQIYKYVTRTADEAAVDTFINTYMHLDDINANDHSDTNACRDSGDGHQGYYATAKAAYSVLTDDQKLIFHTYDETRISKARARLTAWAAANGESFNGDLDLVKGASPLSLSDGLTIGNEAIPMIITILSGGIVAAGGIFLMSRRRRER